MLGKDAVPQAIQDAVKAKHGVELPMKIVSNYKSLVLKKKGAGKKMGRPPKSAAAPTTASVSSNGKSGGISLDDIKAVKALAEKIGASKLRELADVLS